MFKKTNLSQRIMKKQHLLLWAFISLITFASCTGNKDKTHGDTSSTPMTVDDVLLAAEQEIDNNVIVEGVCTHVCSHGGRKIFLIGEDDSKTIRIESSDAIGAFKSECVNAIVNVKGKLKEERIDEAYLLKWEAELAAGTSEEHGDDGEGCETEQKAQGQDTVTDDQGRIENFRTRIAERNETEGKDYLSFYYIEADGYSIL